MDVRIEDISNVKKKLSIEVAPEQVDAEMRKAWQKIGKTAKVKGFRPGKVPQAMLEKYYGPQMEEQVLTRLINDSYLKAIMEHRIVAVSDPQIAASGTLEAGKPFAYEALVEVKPEFEAKDYQGLSLVKEKFAADDKIVQERLEEMRASRSQMEESARQEAAGGDFVTIDFEGFIEGSAFAGGKAEDYVLELGSGSFIPGFEEQLQGMRLQEERDIQVTFPAEYGNKELAGKPAVFKVKLKAIKEKVLPALDDEFARGFGVESLEELKQKLGESHDRQEQRRIDEDLRERLVTALIERNPIDVPEAMVASQLEYMLDNVRRRLESQGMRLEMLGMNEESFRAGYRETAVRQVQGALILETIARQENLRVEPGEIDGKLESIAEMSNAPLEAVQKYYASREARQGLIASLAEEKVIQFLLEKAQVTEVDRAELEGEGAKPAAKEKGKKKKQEQ